MSLVSVKVDGMEEVVSKLGKYLAEGPHLVGQALYTSAQFKLRPLAQAMLRKNRNVFRGQLFQRVSVRVAITSAKEVSIEFGSLGVPYALNVELGSPPHEPDINKLREYAMKKMGFDSDRADSVAAAIFETISAEGTKPHPYIMPTWETGKMPFTKDALDRIAAAFKRM